jgi:predicted GTPase
MPSSLQQGGLLLASQHLILFCCLATQGCTSDVRSQSVRYNNGSAALPMLPTLCLQEQRSKLDERMMAAVVSSIKAAEVIIAVVDSGEAQQQQQRTCLLFTVQATECSMQAAGA